MTELHDSMDMIRVLIIADSIVVRTGLEAIITTQDMLTVVGSFSNRETLPQIDELQPDVILLEADWQDDDTASAWAWAEAGLTSPAIVLLTDDIQTLGSEALRSGGRGLLSTNATTSEIVAAIEAAAAGLVVLSPDVVGVLLPNSPNSPKSLPALAQDLTPREIEVLQMLAEGMGNKAIARQLTISEHTVKFHVSSIFSKLNASSRTEAVTLGARQGLILL
jgi:DNA-binding NarL/FixJ family response regulator